VSPRLRTVGGVGGGVLPAKEEDGRLRLEGARGGGEAYDDGLAGVDGGMEGGAKSRKKMMGVAQ
jgi:hypothetical protein